jgi:uncharacterized protein DUF1236
MRRDVMPLAAHRVCWLRLMALAARPHRHLFRRIESILLIGFPERALLCAVGGARGSMHVASWRTSIMKKMNLLSTVAAAALALSFGAAYAENNMDKGGGAAPGAMERTAPGGATEQAPPKAGAPKQAQAPAGAAKVDEKNAQAPAADHSKNAQAPAADHNKMSSEKPAADTPAQKTGDAKQTMPDGKSNTNAKSEPNAAAKTTVGAAPSSETKMTTEQRTQIREKVIATGPKVANVNFSLNVGTVVPRTVQVVEVPMVIIDIHPEWRGYRYFVVNEQIIIVERDSLRIVAVLDV